MRRWALVPAHAGSASAQVRGTSFKAQDGSRTLEEWVDIKGSAACVWKQPSLMSSSGTAGCWRKFYRGCPAGWPHPPPDYTYIPERLLVQRKVSTPKELVSAELYPKIVQVIFLEPRQGGITRLTIAQTGYGEGAGYDRLYDFFRNGNGGYLASAKKACEPR